MLYWKYSPNRTFFLNEYWIFIPSGLVINYFIIRKMRSNRRHVEELKKLIEQIEYEKKLRKILAISLGLNLSASIHILCRGGDMDSININEIKETMDYINVDNIICKIFKGISYLDNNKLRKIIHNLYRKKKKGKIIYIIATAVCHLANIHGQNYPALPVTMGDFGITDVYQTVRKGFTATLLTSVGPVMYKGTYAGWGWLILAALLGTLGLRLALHDLDVEFIPTSPIDWTKTIKPRIPDLDDVVVINNRDKIIMMQPQNNKECWLADQNLLNSNCRIEETEIPHAIDSVLPNLKYKDTVNMQDVTGLDRVQFSDKYDFGQTPQSTISNPSKGKEINFLDQFGDSQPISENEGWETCENDFTVPEKRYLRTRNKP